MNKTIEEQNKALKYIAMSCNLAEGSMSNFSDFNLDF